MRGHQLNLFEHAAVLEAVAVRSNVIDARFPFEDRMSSVIAARVIGIPLIRRAGVLVILDEVRRCRASRGSGTSGEAA